MKSYDVITLPGVLHLVFKTRKAMNIAMCRLSEFYESPSAEIRGKHFCLAEFIDAYSDEHGGIAYFEDIEGHNIPGGVVDSFFELFELSKFEQAVQAAWGGGYKYLIATDEESDLSTITHEMAHAKWFMDKAYREKAKAVLDSIGGRLRSKMVLDLLAYGVPDTEIVWDEMHAYLISANEAELNTVFKGVRMSDIAPYIRALRALNGESWEYDDDDEKHELMHC